MSENLNSLLATLESKLNGPLAPGVNVFSDLDELRLNALVLGKTHLYIRTKLTGRVKIAIDSNE